MYDEKYEFTWIGKSDSKKEAYTKTNKVLTSCKEESVNWDKTENLYIEGDNLDVLKLLQESYLGKVKMIYIDPPYNTGKNYIYRNDFKLYGIDKKRVNKNTPKEYLLHSGWCNMIYQRLLIARKLLSHDGVFVCAIDENEFANLAIVLKEIFLESEYNHVYVSVVHNPRGQQGVNFSYVNEYLIFIFPSDGKKYIADFPKNEIDSRNLRDSGTESNRTDARMCFYPFYVKNEKIVRIGSVPDDSFHPASSNIYCPDGTIEVWPITDDGNEKKWRYARQSVETILNKLEPKFGRNSLQIIFNKDEGTMRSVWNNARYDASEYGTKLLDKLLGGCPFTFPKSLYSVYDCVKAVTKYDKNAIILDFFSGSGTTAHAIMQLNAEDGGNRKFIMVQLPEPCDEKSEAFKAGYKNICEIGKERIRRAGKKIINENPDKADSLDIGFKVFKAVESISRKGS